MALEFTGVLEGECTRVLRPDDFSLPRVPADFEERTHSPRDTPGAARRLW